MEYLNKMASPIGSVGSINFYNQIFLGSDVTAEVWVHKCRPKLLCRGFVASADLW